MQGEIIPFLTCDQLKLLGKGKNNAIFSFKIIEYKDLVMRIPFRNDKKKRDREYEELQSEKLLANLKKYLVKPVAYLQVEEYLLEELEQKYGLMLTRQTSSFPMLRNFYSKELKSDQEEVVVVEVKPKMGVVQPLISKIMLERAGQQFKVPYCLLKEKKEIKLGLKQHSTHYDPRMLYSGDQDLMLQAITRLSSTPNRYWNVKPINSSLDMEDKNARQYLSKLVVSILSKSGVLQKLVTLQSFVTAHPLSYYLKLIENQLQYYTQEELQAKVVEKLQKIQDISELGNQLFEDKILKVLAGRLAGDVTLMLRISTNSLQHEQIQADNEIVVKGENGPVRCKFGIIDFDAKYLYQFEDWAEERKKTIDLLIE